MTNNFNPSILYHSSKESKGFSFHSSKESKGFSFHSGLGMVPKWVHNLSIRAKFHRKIPLKKWFFKFWSVAVFVKRKFISGRHFETIQIFLFFVSSIFVLFCFYFISFCLFFCWNMVVISAYISGAKIISKFRWKNYFLKVGFPLCA